MTLDAAEKAPGSSASTAPERADVLAEAALVLDANEAATPDPPPPFAVCGHCGGPVYFCDGNGCSREGAAALDPSSLLWLTAIRALLLGTFLSRTVGSGYGGVLVLAARAMVGASAPPSSERMADALPHPGYELRREAAAELAVAYLRGGDLDALSQLSASLRTTNDAMLWRRRREAEKAALSTPWRGARHVLLALVCEGCAGRRALADDVHGDAIPWAHRLEAVTTYDAALRCPTCGALHEHPLPGLPIGLPHPVTRCTGGCGGNPEHCMVHGEPLGPEGVCTVGLPMLVQARAWASERPVLRFPWQHDLARALILAQRIELERRIASGDLVKQVVGSAELRPFFAAAASMSPEMAHGLVQLTGQPFRTEDADPEAIAFLGGLAPLFKGLAKVGGVLTRLLGGGPKARRARRLLPGRRR